MFSIRKPSVVESIVESITVLAIVAVLVLLLFTPDSATATRRQLEGRARDWKPSAARTVPDAALMVTDLSLAGEWATRRRLHHTVFNFTERRDGRYDVRFSTGGCMGGCQLSRIATMNAGVILLDGAVAEYGPRTYDTLYAIRVANVEYLLPAQSVPEFQRELAPGLDDREWKWYVHTRGDESNERTDQPERTGGSDFNVEYAGNTLREFKPDPRVRRD